MAYNILRQLSDNDIGDVVQTIGNLRCNRNVHNPAPKNQENQLKVCNLIYDDVLIANPQE